MPLLGPFEDRRPDIPRITQRSDGFTSEGAGSFKVGDCVAVDLDGSWGAAEILEVKTNLKVKWFSSVDDVPTPDPLPDELIETDHTDCIPYESVMGHIDWNRHPIRYKLKNRILLKRSKKRKLAKIQSDVLHGRETELAKVNQFLRHGRSLYIAGLPGTGKTASVHQCAKGLKFVEINAMKLPRPSYAYSLLWQAMTGELKAGETALRLLEMNLPQTPILVLLDELDYLGTTVLYNFFDWPTRSKLKVIGIANTLDLPERLDPKVRSRLETRLIFHPYKYDDILAILQSRVDKSLFENRALEMAARKTASYSGDIRRGLQTCALAMELAQGDKVTIADVTTAYKQLVESVSYTAVKTAAPFERLVLAALCAELRVTPQVPFDSIMSRLQRMTNKFPVHSDVLAILTRFTDEARILSSEYLASSHRLPAFTTASMHVEGLIDALRDTKDPVVLSTLSSN